MSHCGRDAAVSVQEGGRRVKNKLPHTGRETAGGRLIHSELRICSVPLVTGSLWDTSGKLEIKCDDRHLFSCSWHGVCGTVLTTDLLLM